MDEDKTEATNRDLWPELAKALKGLAGVIVAEVSHAHGPVVQLRLEPLPDEDLAAGATGTGSGSWPRASRTRRRSRRSSWT